MVVEQDKLARPALREIITPVMDGAPPGSIDLTPGVEEEVHIPPLMQVDQVSVYFGRSQALHDVTATIPHGLTTIIGPSGCGKSTFLRLFDRMHDLTPAARVTGAIHFGNEDILGSNVDLVKLRQRVGMVFQRPNPFPKTIFENVAYGLRVQGNNDPEKLAEIVQRSLQSAALWDEVSDRLHTSALRLSGGQQQRLCIARVLAVDPEVILMDEPCSALDPIATRKIEVDVMQRLLHEEHRSIIMVTHNMQQAQRLENLVGESQTAFFLSGRLVEMNSTGMIFSHPNDKRTEDFITGKFG